MPDDRSAWGRRPTCCVKPRTDAFGAGQHFGGGAPLCTFLSQDWRQDRASAGGGRQEVLLRALCFSELPLQKPCAISLCVKFRAASRCSKVAVSPLLSGVSLGGVGVRGAVSLQRMPCSKGDLSCGLFECAALGIGRMFGRKWSPHDRPEVAAWVALLKIRTCVESTFSARC